MVSHESTKPKKGFEFVAKCETFFFSVVAIDEHRSFFFLSLLGLLVAAGDNTGKGISQ
jgi:hypothetical protein